MGGSDTTFALSVDSVTVRPAAGAGAFKVRVPVTVFDIPTVLALNDIAIAAWVTLTVALPGLKFGAVPNTVDEPGDTGVTVAVVLVWPSGIVTDAGSVTRPPRLVRLIT